MAKRKKRMKQEEFDLVYRAVFEGVEHPKAKYKARSTTLRLPRKRK